MSLNVILLKKCQTSFKQRKSGRQLRQEKIGSLGFFYEEFTYEILRFQQALSITN